MRGGLNYLNGGTSLVPAAAPDDLMHVEVYKRLQHVMRSEGPPLSPVDLQSQPAVRIPAIHNGARPCNYVRRHVRPDVFDMARDMQRVLCCSLHVMTAVPCICGPAHLLPDAYLSCSVKDMDCALN